MCKFFTLHKKKGPISQKILKLSSFFDIFWTHNIYGLTKQGDKVMKQYIFTTLLGTIGLASTNISLADQTAPEEAHSAYLVLTDAETAPTPPASNFAGLDTLGPCVVVSEDNSVTDCNEEQSDYHVALNEIKKGVADEVLSTSRVDLAYESSKSAVLNTLSHCVVVLEDNSVVDCRTMQSYSSAVQRLSRKLGKRLDNEELRAYIQGGVGAVLIVSAVTLFTTMNPAFIIIGAMTIVGGTALLLLPTLSSAKRAMATAEILNLIKNGAENNKTIRGVFRILVNESNLHVSTERLLNILGELDWEH